MDSAGLAINGTTEVTDVCVETTLLKKAERVIVTIIFFIRKEVAYRGHCRPYITILEGGLLTETATWFWVNFKIKNNFFCPVKKRNVCPFWQNETISARPSTQGKRQL